MRVVTNFTANCRGLLCAVSGSSASGTTPSGSTPAPAKGDAATRFHGSKALDPTRAVRDISQISDAILALFTVNGLPVTVTVDIASSALEKLTLDPLTALKEDLNTLGFQDWNVE